MTRFLDQLAISGTIFTVMGMMMDYHVLAGSVIFIIAFLIESKGEWIKR